MWGATYISYPFQKTLLVQPMFKDYVGKYPLQNRTNVQIKGGGVGQRPFEQCLKKLHFSYGTASLRTITATINNLITTITTERGFEKFPTSKIVQSVIWSLKSNWNKTMLLALIPSDTWDIRSPSRQWWRLKLKQASHFSSPRSNGSLRTGLQPCGLHKILWWRSSAKEKYYIHIRFGQITKKEKRIWEAIFFHLFVHEGKERIRSLDRTGKVFICWKRIEAKESNLLLVVVSTWQTQFLFVKKGVCLSVW